MKRSSRLVWQTMCMNLFAGKHFFYIFFQLFAIMIFLREFINFYDKIV